MAIFTAILVHPDGDGWNRHLRAHVEYLQGLVAKGTLRASGPYIGTPERSGLLIIEAADRAEAEAIVAGDPFSHHGVIKELTITEWDPLFGVFSTQARSSVDTLLAKAIA